MFKLRNLFGASFTAFDSNSDSFEINFRKRWGGHIKYYSKLKEMCLTIVDSSRVGYISMINKRDVCKKNTALQHCRTASNLLAADIQLVLRRAYF